jgi:Icc-related predicted phosphoesterase
MVPLHLPLLSWKTPLKLLVFSDIHGDWKRLEQLLASDADYYIAAGDQVTWARGLDRAGEILQSRGDRVYVLPGNHESADQVSAMCAHYGLNDLHGRHFEAGRWQIAGLGYSSPTPFNTPGEYSEPQLAEHLSRFADLKPLVLICHAPPYQTALDRIREGLHAGSRSVADFIERYQPEYFCCGHIHEAEGVSANLGSTRAYNVGKRGHLLELD